MRHLSLLEGRPLRRCSKQVGIAFSYGRARVCRRRRVRVHSDLASASIAVFARALAPPIAVQLIRDPHQAAVETPARASCAMPHVHR
jgi:hypothetical protein